MIDISATFDELLQHNINISDLKSYNKQKLNEDSFYDELLQISESNSRKKRAESKVGTLLTSAISLAIDADGSLQQLLPLPSSWLRTLFH